MSQTANVFPPGTRWARASHGCAVRAPARWRGHRALLA